MCHFYDENIYFIKLKNIIMVVKRNYVLGIINEESIREINDIILSYSSVTQQSTSHMYFAKQPVDNNKFNMDVTFFQLEDENISLLRKKTTELIHELDKLDTDYVLRDGETGRMLVIVDFGGKLIINFENVETIKEGTFEKINELKQLKTDYGYTKGFVPNFRPVEGKSIRGLHINPEIIFLISDSTENLSKLIDCVSEEIAKTDPDLSVEFKPFNFF